MGNDNLNRWNWKTVRQRRCRFSCSARGSVQNPAAAKASSTRLRLAGIAVPVSCAQIWMREFLEEERELRELFEGIGIAELAGPARGWRGAAGSCREHFRQRGELLHALLVARGIVLRAGDPACGGFPPGGNPRERFPGRVRRNPAGQRRSRVSSARRTRSGRCEGMRRASSSKAVRAATRARTIATASPRPDRMRRRASSNARENDATSRGPGRSRVEMDGFRPLSRAWDFRDSHSPCWKSRASAKADSGRRMSCGSFTSRGSQASRWSESVDGPGKELRDRRVMRKARFLLGGKAANLDILVALRKSGKEDDGKGARDADLFLGGEIEIPRPVAQIAAQRGSESRFRGFELEDVACVRRNACAVRGVRGPRRALLPWGPGLARGSAGAEAGRIPAGRERP